MPDHPKLLQQFIWQDYDLTAVSGPEAVPGFLAARTGRAPFGARGACPADQAVGMEAGGRAVPLELTGLFRPRFTDRQAVDRTNGNLSRMRQHDSEDKSWLRR
jgi:hypothetical protein